MIDQLKDKIVGAIKKAGYTAPEDFDLEISSNESFGDYSTNVAMTIAGKTKKDPEEVAEKIIKKFSDKEVMDLEIAGRGFINIKLSDSYFHSVLSEILKSGEDFGKSEIGKGKKANVEFISANPTGPLHIGNARGGPIGEVISNVLFWQGFDVKKEFYLNDSGNQINRFGETLAYWYTIKRDENFHFPDGGYPGEFSKEISEEIQKEKAKEIEELKDDELIEFFVRHGLEKTMRRIKEDISALGIHFDRFFYESDLLNSGKSLEVVEKLKTGGHTTDREGALWFISNDLDPNDRETVLIRSDADKTPTYFANDIAYHIDKFERGFEKIIDIWGPNHHAHIPRIKSALKVLGFDEKEVSIFLYQNVKLKTGGQVKQMGKRLGNFINISDLVGKLKVSPDVYKFAIINQNPNSIIEFDLDLALEQSEKNPVFYLQYAYARICSVLRKADADLLADTEKIARGEQAIEPGDLKILNDKKERKLIKTISRLPQILNMVSAELQVQALPHFATEIAREYHNFYANCLILSDDKQLTKARLLLALATRNVLKISLTLMGISAPEKM
jgi:arginyl-tRNA synthetase